MSALLHVCAPCTHPDREKRGPVKAGELFASRLAAEVATRPELAELRVVAAPCIGNCAARCRLSFAGPGRWSWLIGGLDPDAPTDDLLEFARHWLEAPDGFVGKDDRPKPIRPLLLGRVPPPGLPELREPSTG
jgi:predicted metal-binding protein